MQRIGDVVDSGTAAGELLLNRQADPLNEVLVGVLLLHFFLKLRRQHPQQLGIARDEWARSVGGPKDNSVTRGPANHRTAKMTFQGLQVRAGLDELQPERHQSPSSTQTANGKHPGKATFHENGWLVLVGEKPAKLDAPFVVVYLLDDLFR